MLELQSKIKADKEEILGGVSAHLHSLGVKASFVEEPLTDYFGNITKEAVIELSGQSIQKIRLLALDYGTTQITFRFQYEMLLDESLPHDVKRLQDAKIKLIKDNKTFGLFGGRVADVKWGGNGIAERLNTDRHLSSKLVDFAQRLGNLKMQIHTKSASQIEIYGPECTIPYYLTNGQIVKGASIDSVAGVFDFEIFEMVADHISRMLNSAE